MEANERGQYGIMPEDIEVRAIPQPECECGAPQTHWVRLDLRALGQTNEIYRGCAECCHEAVALLRTHIAESYAASVGRP